MTKSHYDYNVYTPELISELQKLVQDLPRAEGVKRLMKRLNISDRNARRQYAKYIQLAANPVSDVDKPTHEPRDIRRLVLDLETSPNLGLFWRTGVKLTILPESIVKERAIICAGYKWVGEKETHVLIWDQNQDDRELLVKLSEIIGQADEIIIHNGARFDMPWVRTRCLYHGLPPIPDVKIVDTLKFVRGHFLFNSNKLDYIAKLLGIGSKIKTGFDLWKSVLLKNDRPALKEMARYCKGDVELLEKVWGRLREWMPAKVHAAVLSGGDKWQCPKTGSTQVCLSKTRVTASGTIQYQMKGPQGYYTISARAFEEYKAFKKDR